MPKDNENISLTNALDEPETFSPSHFTPDQMVRCEACLRANPPTRVHCLYCGAALPRSETTTTQQRPTLRPLETWELGFNNILLPPAPDLTETSLAEVSELLRLRRDDLNRILAASVPMPLARAATIDEATLIKRRLGDLKIKSTIVADQNRGANKPLILKVRSIDLDEERIYAYQNPDTDAVELPWDALLLIVSGRLIVKRVELKEQKGKRDEHLILDASEFATDEVVVDFYYRNHELPYRISANSFDFSCLGAEKTLLAGENMARLVRLFRQHSPKAQHDDNFNSLRKALEPVWPSTQQNDSSGWRRERPGKISLGTITELSNETQFLRYSQLRHHMQTASPLETNDDA